MGKVLRDEPPMPQGPGRDERIEELVDTLECPVCLDTADTAPIYQVTTERQFLFSKIAKDCLLTGQEQACTRITLLFVCSFVTTPKMAKYTGKWLLTPPSDHIQNETLSRPDKTEKEE